MGTPPPPKCSRSITRNGVVIPPMETRFIPVSVRSHGMCADGSCNGRGFDVTGFFGDPCDNDFAAGCAISLLVVGNSARLKSLIMGSGRAPVLPGGSFQVDSFFDVFYEINMDNGAGMVEIKPPSGSPFTINDTDVFSNCP